MFAEFANIIDRYLLLEAKTIKFKIEQDTNFTFAGVSFFLELSSCYDHLVQDKSQWQVQSLNKKDTVLIYFPVLNLELHGKHTFVLI